MKRNEEFNFSKCLSKKILIVDDEGDITDLIEAILVNDGFTNIFKAHTGSEAINCFHATIPDIVVLDVMLPDMDGMYACKKIREISYCPIIFLSSKSDDIDKVLGLSSGGDDYITKPFSPRELSFRIKAQLRRKEYDQMELPVNISDVCRVGALSIDFESKHAYMDDTELILTAREFGLLSFLMQNAGKIISKEQLYEAVWGEEGIACDNTIMVHIRHLREKIEKEPSNPRLLVTVKGLGYKLVKE